MSCSIGTLTVPFVTPRGAAIPLEHYDEAAKCAELINRVGISATSSTFQWAVDLYEKGVLTKADTGGLDLRRGNYQAVQELIRQIGAKEGFGAVVGQTFDKVQARLKPKLAGYHDYRGHFLEKREEGVPYGGKRWTVLFFGTVVDPRGDGPGTAYGSPTWMPGRSGSSLKRYGERIGITDQDLNRVFNGQRDGYDTAHLTHSVELYNIVLYSLGLCQRAFISRALPLDRIADLYTVGTGIKVTPQELREKAERIITVQRLFNVREGWTRDRELYPKGYLMPEHERELQQTLTDYYRLHNWDPNTGAPSEDAMVRLDIAPAGQGAKL
jgi:aldehyde:ferredoxin oxidoreductase